MKLKSSRNFQNICFCFMRIIYGSNYTTNTKNELKVRRDITFKYRKCVQLYSLVSEKSSGEFVGNLNKNEFPFFANFLDFFVFYGSGSGKNSFYSGLYQGFRPVRKRKKAVARRHGALRVVSRRPWPVLSPVHSIPPGLAGRRRCR